MEFINQFNIALEKRKNSFAYNSIWDKLHLDGPLFILIMLLLICSMILLYSATNGNSAKLIRQFYRIIICIFVMIFIAQIHPNQFKRWTVTLFCIGTSLLLFVNLMGYTGKGAQRWIDLGLFRFQPSEVMKCAMPMMLALYLSRNPLPDKTFKSFFILCLMAIPCYLILKQPDLGTATLLILSIFTMFFLSGIKIKHLFYTLLFSIAISPVLWHYMHDYQKIRVLTFINPYRDPLRSGYHIIQSEIAIGSGGIFGKGLLNGTQSHLEYLPESSTDFIFALCGEEFGLLGCMFLIAIYTLITCRVLYLARFMTDLYSKLLSSTLGIIFYLYALINIGMVSGIFPVVGQPLPLVSYGGTSLLTIMICFGIIMSTNSHRKLIHEL